MIRPVEQRKQRSVAFHLRYAASHAVPTRVPNVIALSSVAGVGLGYIRLPSAGAGERVNRGEAPFPEPDLSVAVSGAVAMGRLRAQREMPSADAYVIAVPTPFTADHDADPGERVSGPPRRADLSYITAAAEAIADVLRGGEGIGLASAGA